MLEAAALRRTEALSSPADVHWMEVVLSLIDEPHSQARALELIEGTPIRARLGLALFIAGFDGLPTRPVQLPPTSNLARASRAVPWLAKDAPKSFEDALRVAAERGMPSSWVEDLRTGSSP